MQAAYACFIAPKLIAVRQTSTSLFSDVLLCMYVSIPLAVLCLGWGSLVGEVVPGTPFSEVLLHGHALCSQSRVKLGWRVSPELILDAGEASLDDNCADLKERGLGSRLATYVASMAQRTEIMGSMAVCVATLAQWMGLVRMEASASAANKLQAATCIQLAKLVCDGFSSQDGLQEFRMLHGHGYSRGAAAWLFCLKGSFLPAARRIDGSTYAKLHSVLVGPLAYGILMGPLAP
eukprot:scaffold131352_cov23-Tisochrysis_lutea.AAC.1